jgi:sarcosine oxidase
MFVEAGMGSATVRATPQRAAWLRNAVPAPPCPSLAASARADAIVIGAGYTGLQAALRLAEHGRDCIVLEAEDPGFGASGRNGGQVIPGLKHDPSELVAMLGEARGMALARFAGEAAGRTFDQIAQYGLTCDAQRCGWLQPAVDEATLATVVRRAEAWSDVAGVDMRVLDRAATRALTGTDMYVGGWIDPRGGQLQPLSYARELARVAAERGVRIHGRSAAQCVQHENGRWHVTANGHVVEAPLLLICTHGYSGELLPGLAQSFVPASSIICATRPLTPALRSKIMPGGLPISDARRLLNYMRYDADGRFLIGARGSFGLQEPAYYFAWLRTAARRIFPALAETEWEDAWGGRFALTLDHLPHIYNPEPGQFSAAGCNGRGVAMMSQIGRLLADLATESVSPEESPLPVRELRAIPLHALRRPALEAVTLYYRGLDFVGL